MACLFGCFRIKRDNPPNTNLISDAISSKTRDPSASQTRLASLLLSEDNGGSPHKDTAHCSFGSPSQDNIDRELKDEAKFLKYCGTLLETPVEIRKTSEKVKNLLNDGDSETSKFHSWLSSAPSKKNHWEEQPNLVPISPVRLCDELGKEPGSLDHKPISCMAKGRELAVRNSTRFPENSGVENLDTKIKIPVNSTVNSTAESTQCKNKYVHFECQSDMVDPSLSGQSLKQSDSSGCDNGSKYSPYPTPLKLTDEMQTPGTFYPVSLESLANGKNVQIRSQYAYTVLNPVQNYELKALKEEDSTHNQPCHLGESFEQSENACPVHISVPYRSQSAMEDKGESTVGQDSKVDANSFQLLKQSSSPKDERTQNCGSTSSGRTHSSQTPERDRPILGTVATHWNNYESSCISSKWWDGNGIPNSTNKYKEDQRVNWHATPFEERLEKALSDESLVYQKRLPDGRPVFFDENEENDTAISRLQSSDHPESVVSF